MDGVSKTVQLVDSYWNIIVYYIMPCYFVMDITYEGTDIIVCVYILLYHYLVAPMLATYYMS